MYDREKDRGQRPLDLVEWIDVRIAQRLEQCLEQRAPANARHGVEAEHRKLVEVVKAEREKMIIWSRRPMSGLSS